MTDAIKNNNIETLINMIGKNWNYGFHLACKFNRLHIAKYMISKGAIHLGEQLYWACRNQNIEMINLILLYEKKLKLHDLNCGLGGACEANNTNLVDLMISLGANNFDMGLMHACKRGNMGFATYMISKGGNINCGLYSACSNGHKNLIDHFSSLENINLNSGLDGACHGGNKEIIDYIIEKGADDYNRRLLGE